MSNEAHSRETCPTVRWGESAAEIPSVNVVEPSGGKKDTGWVPGVDRPNAGWWNWLHWADGVFHRYVERAWDLLWPVDQIMAGNSSATAVVTAGTGLSVDITSAVMWIDGAMYTFVAANDLALTAAHATLSRRDLVVARLVGGVPTWVVIAGTPGSGVAPSASAGDVSVAEVLIPATAVAPSTITDIRLRGNVEVDRVESRRYLDAGSLGGGAYMLRVHDYNGDPATVEIGDGLINVTQLEVTLAPGAVALSIPQTHYYELSPPDFLGADISWVNITTGTWDLTAGNVIRAPIRVPPGREIKAVRVFGNKTLSPVGVQIQIKARNKASHVLSDVIGSPGDTAGDPTGNFTAEETLSYTPDGSAILFLELTASGSGAGLHIQGAEVEYEETNPLVGV